MDVPGASGHRPHITLAAYETDDIPALHACLAAFAATHAPFPLRLHALGVFPEARVLFLAPRVTRRLLMLHAALLEAVQATVATPLKYAHNLGIESWTPHCTAAIAATNDALSQVFQQALESWEPLEVVVEGIGVVAPPATSDYAHYAFGKPATMP